MLRFAALIVVPALVGCGLLGDVDTSTCLVLVGVSLIGTAVELLGNSGGKKQRPSVVFFFVVCIFTFALQVSILLHSHVATAHAAAAAAAATPGAQQPVGVPAPHLLANRSLLSRGRAHSVVDAAAAAATPSAAATPAAALGSSSAAAKFGGELRGGGTTLRTVSIVLPCAEERMNALNTVERFCSRTPKEQLAEIIVVDDGSNPPLVTLFEKDQRALHTNPDCKVRFLRHEQTIGLMAAKLTGGKAATGDVVAFFDCHCSPKDGWHEEILEQINENPRRMVVPAITDLDMDTFDEKKDSSVNAKCYLTFDLDFKWFDDESDFVPTISGGLIVMGREWFNLTGGFDEEMHGWGGENLDQSLRAWLCGGEITRAKSSRVAHMWRTGDPRTATHYSVRAKFTNNRGRVAAAWFDEFISVSRAGQVSRKDVSNFDSVKKRLGCRPFVYFLYRFRKIYINAGVIAKKVFHLKEKSSGLCMARLGGTISAAPCSQGSHGQQMQLGNFDREAGSCCSGLRQYSTNDCLDFVDAQGVHWYSCDVSGMNGNQQYRLGKDGLIRRPNGECLYVDKKAIRSKPCGDLHAGVGVFEKVHPFEPKEYAIYKKELKRHRFEADLPDLPDN